MRRFKSGAGCKNNRKMKPLTEHQFHAVWTNAVGRAGYDKRLFQSVLEDMIEKNQVIPTQPQKSFLGSKKSIIIRLKSLWCDQSK